MAASSFIQFPNGDLIDCQNAVLTAYGGSTIFVIAPDKTQYYSYATANPAAAKAVLMTISANVTANFVTFANGDIVDCQNCVLTAQGDVSSANILVYSPKNVQFYSYAYDNVTDAQTALNGIATQVGANNTSTSVSSVVWGVGAPSGNNLPVNVAPGTAIGFQINGTNLPLNTQYALIDGTVTFQQIAVSATQISTGNFVLGLPAGTYDLQLIDIDSNVLADFGNIISVIAS